MNIRLTHKLVQEARDTGSINDLAKWVTMKYRFVNGCIYDYSPYKAEKLFKDMYSRNTIKRLVDSFIKYGWCRMHEGNLMFKKASKIDGKIEFKIQVEDIDDWREVRDKINLYLIENKSRQAEFAIKAKSDSEIPTNQRQLKRGKQNLRRLSNLNGTMNPNFQISYDGLKEVIGCGSKSNAFYLINSLVRKGLLCKKNSFFVYEGYHSTVSVEHVLSGVFFVSNGKLIQILPNQYEVSLSQ